MVIKKSELYSSLWASCDALRGGMDARQIKQGMMQELLTGRIRLVEFPKPWQRVLLNV